MINCKEFVESYLQWLGAHFQVAEEGNECRVVTPFLTPSADPIVVYLAQRGADSLRLSDRGFTGDSLFLGGINTSSAKNAELIRDSIAGYRIGWDNEEMKVECDLRSFAPTLHAFVGAMLSVLDLQFTAREEEPAVPFLEEVKSYLDAEHKSYLYSESVRGDAIEHKIDFIFNHRGTRYAQTLSATTRYRAQEASEKLAFEFLDIRRVNNAFVAIAIFDDRKDVWNPDTRQIIAKYSDVAIPWGQKGNILQYC